jgi:hypothetical protein
MTIAAPGRSVLLVVTNLVVATLAVWPWLPGHAPSSEPTAASDGRDAPRLVSLPPFASFDATLDRPLFSPSRRPQAASASGPGASIDSRYRLQGLVIAGKTRHALVTPAAGGPALELAEGATLEGWTVKRIEQDRVVLVSPSGEAVLKLQRAGPAPPAAR